MVNALHFRNRFDTVGQYQRLPDWLYFGPTIAMYIVQIGSHHLLKLSTKIMMVMMIMKTREKKSLCQQPTCCVQPVRLNCPVGFVVHNQQ